MATQEYIITGKEMYHGEIGFMFNDAVKLQDMEEETTMAIDASLLTHDFLEHVNGLEEIGTVSDELMATGAFFYGRVSHCIEGASWDGAMSDIESQLIYLKSGCKFLDHEKEVDQDHEFFEEIEELVKETLNKVDLQYYELTEDDLPRLENNIIATMLKGITQAEKRYNSGWTLACLYSEMKEKIQKAINTCEHWYEEICIAMNWETLEFSVETQYTQDYLDSIEDEEDEY